MLPLRESALALTAAVACAALAALLATRPAARPQPPPCVTERQEVTVRGRSLGTLAPSGSTLELWVASYRCTLPERGHWVALALDGREVPVAKVVHGVPGDRFEVVAAPGGLFLEIGGQRVHNARGEALQLDARAWRLLRHLGELTGGVVPEGSYLVFGELAAVTVDSRAFGLLAQESLIGRLVPTR